MGIKHLWSILGPYYERKPLYELQGKTVAIDLSCWICEAQNIAEYQVQPRMYLRNLYFRTCYLLLMEVHPVFVLEGKAPELKFDTIAARNAIQFKGAKPKTEGTKTSKDRTRFHFVLRQCEEMLGYLGLACIKGKGEAESLCAYLNENGLVDGCISQDSDCFAYGANVVYRNFSISQQGAHAAMGGAVDVYDIRKVDKTLDLGRNKIVTMALLLGCDYTEGVHGIGRDSVVKFFENISDKETLDRIRSWRTNEEHFTSLENKINNKNNCTNCGHYGKLQKHTKSGCNACMTNKGCDSSKYKEERLLIKNELNIRSKSLVDPDFPNEVLIKEYLTKKDNVSSLDLRWRQPNMVKFVEFASKFLTWEEIYAFEKILPILARWQVMNPEAVQKQKGSKGLLVPNRIKKVRNPKGIPSYEIIWTDSQEHFKGLIPDEQLVNQDLDKLWSTIEPQKLVEQSYPELVEAYQQSKIKPKKPSKRKAKVTVDDLGEILKNTSINEVKAKKVRKPRQKKVSNDEILKNLENSFGELNIGSKVKVSTIDIYFRQALVNNLNLKNFQSTPGKTLNGKENNLNECFDPDMSNFGDEDDCNVSDIVEDIISRKPNLLKLVKEKVGDVEVADSSNFFCTNPVEEDIFEKTFNMMVGHSDSEGDKGESDKDEDDSFVENYVPLHERIRMKKLCDSS